MIYYKRGGSHLFARIRRLRGSVFPGAFVVAFPCAACTAAVKLLSDYGLLPGLGEEDSILKNNALWSGLTFLVGFLIVFRTSQAYSRFWDSCTQTHQMRAEWFDACSSIIAFCRFSSAPQEAQMNFQHLLVRLFSMLHAAALAEIEDRSSDQFDPVEAFRYELLDARALDPESLKTIMECDSRVELLLQWIQQYIVDNVSTGVLSIPPPLLTRAFQELSTGVVAYHGAIKITTIPFPFPYVQTCDILLVMHWLVTPLVVAHWASSVWWGSIFSFMQVFIYWCLNMIAMEIENPFGQDPNDIDCGILQKEFNGHLSMLLQPSTRRLPKLQNACPTLRRDSFYDVWRTSSERSVSVRIRARAAGGLPAVSERSQSLGGEEPDTQCGADRQTSPEEAAPSHAGLGTSPTGLEPPDGGHEPLAPGDEAEPQGCDWAGPAAQCFVSMAGVEASLCAYPEVNVGAGEQDWGAEDPEEAQRQLSTTPSGTASTGSLDSSMPRPPSTNGKRVGMGSFFRTSEIDDATSSSPLAAQRSAWHLARQGVYSCAQHCAVHL
uniref:Bestrophin homolog n=1 Tax=Alexandrium monilatum TaxID=311494 RepID=A0A7S4W6W7_9DINO|mmetsp:Transcript_43901/g.137461  ORF Transcript_43901/g.137461 Transcript_43901/m.137461 type:complete len:549 (-) Transcript_43901:214-1860(-)